MNITNEDEERMDIIGQNGNDGLHYEKEVIKEEPKKEKPKRYQSPWGNPGGDK